MNDFFLISAAGGNITAIEMLDSSLERSEYEDRGRRLLESVPSAEQSGFIFPEGSGFRFEMGGGEFCANGTRAASVAWYCANKLSGPVSLNFLTSGLSEEVVCFVSPVSSSRYFVDGFFRNLIQKKSTAEIHGSFVTVVDMGGIVHVVMPFEEDFPKEYALRHRFIVETLNLSKRDAVGVVWTERKGEDCIAIHPVVWVRGIDSFFYESSCGSGSIATASVMKCGVVCQPTRRDMTVRFVDGGKVISLASEMEVVL